MSWLNRGGIQVDIIGKNMDSVKHPIFIVNEYDATTNITSAFTDVSRVSKLWVDELNLSISYILLPNW